MKRTSAASPSNSLLSSWIALGSATLASARSKVSGESKFRTSRSLERSVETEMSFDMVKT
jgi:hypothetical protein